ncbi:MAG: MBL fold metallo-hydrolase [Bacteroidota bacterium]
MNKRKKYITLATIVLLAIAGFIYFSKTDKMIDYKNNTNLKTIKKDWKGNTFIDGEFANNGTKDPQITPFDILKWKMSKNPQEKEKKEDKFALDVIKNKAFLNSQDDMIVWLGHATFFIRIGGKTLITDPIFYDMPMIKRMAALPCDVSDLKNIDYILLSHGHRDHFDKKSISALHKNNPNIEALVPLKLNDFFEKEKIANQQAGWYQKFETDKDIEIYFMPAKHWNRRGIMDFNKTLWGSFVIRAHGKTIYFAGDTAYGEHFSEVSEFFENIDYCLMPVGAYKPAYIMKESHVTPHEALKAFGDLKGKTFIPMHYATYDLADEPLGEPVRVLKDNNSKRNIKILDIGQPLIIGN